MDALANVLDNYRLTKDIALQRINEGHAAESWLVTSGRKRYVLKRIPKTTSFERIVFITETHDYVSRTANLSPSICRTKNGALFCFDSNGYYIVSTYVAGKKLSAGDLDPGTCHRIGSFLGRLHRGLRGCELGSESSKHLVLPQQAQEKIESLIRYHQNTSKDRMCEEALLYKQYQLKRTGRQFAPFESLPVQVIHGDFYLDNLLFDEMNEPISVVDYDQSCEFLRAYELMRGLVLTIFQSDAPEPDKLPESHLVAFFDGYTEFVDLAPAEVESLVDLYYWVLLCDTSCFEPNDNPRLDFTQMRDFARYRISVLRWVSERRHDIRKLLSKHYSAKVGRDQ